MATVDTLLVRIEVDMSQLKKQLNQSKRQVDNSVGGQRKSFLALGTTIKGVIGVVIAGAVARFSGQMVTMASSVEEMQAKSSVVFGQFVGSVRKELETFGDAVGRSTFELESMASQVQDTFVPLGFARGDAAKLSMQLTKLAVDVASFNNATDIDTMRAFQSALVGNHETVRRFGIVITEAELQQELFRMGIRKSKNEITAQEKVQARLNLIIAGTTDAQGDAERTSDSFANTMKALKAEMQEFIVEAITPLLPKLADMIRSFKDSIISTKEFLREIGFLKELNEIIPVVDKLNENQTKLTETQKKLAKETELLNAIQEMTFLQKTKEMVKANSKFGMSIMQGERVVKERIAQLKLEIKTLENHKELIVMDSDAIIMNSKAKQKNAEQGEKERQQKEKENKLAKQKAENDKKIKKLQDDIKSQIKDLIIDNRLLNAELNGQSELKRKLLAVDIEFKDLTEKDLALLKEKIEENHKLTEALEDQKDAQELIKRTEEERQAKFKESISNAQSIVGTSRDFHKAQTDLNLALQNGIITQEQYNQGMQKLKEEQFALTETGRMAINVVDGLSDGFANTLVTAMETGKLSLKSVGSVVKQVMAEMARDFLKAQIRAMLLRTAMSAIGMGPPPSSAFVGGGNLSGVGTFAGGGKVQARRPVMVGERGPELFVPNTGGIVKNNMDTKGMMSSGKPIVINQNLNFSTGVSQTVRAEVMNMLQKIQSSTLEAMVDAKQRGGAFATIMS